MSKIIFNEHQRRQIEANKEAFLEERRGKESTGRPRLENLSAEKKLEKAEARIQLLEAELHLLKKLDEMERQAKKNRF